LQAAVAPSSPEKKEDVHDVTEKEETTIRERAKLVVKQILLANKEVTTGDLFKQAVEDI